MSWLFNADYESFLFKSDLRSPYDFNSSKINQEFEYLIHFFEEGPIFTKKVYSESFRKKMEKYASRAFLTTDERKEVKPWWCPVQDKKTDQLLHSKETSHKIAKKLGLESGRLVSEANFEGLPNHLYKRLGELSGKGHMIWPRDREKIYRALERGEELLEEPLRERVMDFSSLITSQGEWITYQNIVDYRFQYRGTLVSEFVLPEKWREEYRIISNKIFEEYKKAGAKPPLSMDSYLYKEGGEIKMQTLCEVNPRKTMGYIAWGLRDFFGSSGGAFIVSPSLAKLPKEGLLLSPEENHFQTCFLPSEKPLNHESFAGLL